MTLHRISDELRKQGHTVTVVRPRQPSEAARAEYEETSIVKGLPLPGYEGLRFGLPCRSKLRKLWSMEQPDIIYVATEGPLGQSSIKAARELDIPCVSGFHTNFHEYMKHYKLPILEKIAGGFLRKTHNKTLRTFGPSRDVLSRLDAMGIRGTRLLSRGVDTATFHPSKRSPSLRKRWGVDEATPVALFVSRLAAEKNLPLAIEAFTRIQGKMPDAACVFVGDGPERTKLEKTHPQFIFSGMQTGEALSQHYASADLFIFPSITETFGNVVTEAMASGLVTVAYDYAAPRQFIENDRSGFLATYDDESAYFAAIDRALAAREDWPSIREAAYDAVAGNSWAQVVTRFVDDLEEAIAAP